MGSSSSSICHFILESECGKNLSGAAGLPRTRIRKFDVNRGRRRARTSRRGGRIRPPSPRWKGRRTREVGALVSP